MADNYLQEPLKTLPSVFNDIIRESVGKDLPGERRDGDAGGFSFEDVAKVFKVAVSPADAGEFELRRPDQRYAHGGVEANSVP